MKTGIVFKVDHPNAVILLSDGSFVSIPAKNMWRAGDVVSVPVVTPNHLVLIRACAACLAVMVLSGFLGNWLFFSPVALISVDVNPSIEFSVNRVNRVIAASALNDEGAEILLDANIKNSAYQAALENILTAERTSGYLDSNANVVLTVFSADSTLQAVLLAELQGVVNSKATSYSNEIAAEYHAVDESIIDGAHGHGVTAGKYLYLQQLQELAPETNIAEYSHHSIEQLKGEIATCRQGHGAGGGETSHGETHTGKENCLR